MRAIKLLHDKAQMKKSSNITQIVPYDWCSRCDVCCRFPEKRASLHPILQKMKSLPLCSPV